jgi:hypothetical protein
MGVKMSPAQMIWLSMLSRHGSRYHIQNRRPVKKLAELGLVDSNEFGCTTITEAGRAALTGDQP